MKRGKITFLFVIFIIFLNLNFASAVRISELELNPAGTDSGNEWIELYSSSSVSLDGWHVENVKGKSFNLSGDCSGYCVFITSYNFLTNDKQKIRLADGDGRVIDETIEVSDSANNGKSWQFCGEWIFAESSKDAENNCPVKEEAPINEEEPSMSEEKIVKESADSNAESDAVISEYIVQNETKTFMPQVETITLEKGIKTFKSRTEYIKEYSVYGFTLFLLISLIVLIVFAKRRKNRELV